MKTPLILFVGLTVATCVIAYWSDNLGKKLGKKRISLCGLRPRQTATILSMASSWLIMVLTLIVLVTVSSDLRRALLYYDSIQAQNKSLRMQSAALTQRGRMLADDVKSTEERADAAGVHYRSALNQLGSAQAHLQTAQTSQRDAEAAKAGALSNLTMAQGQLVRTRVQLVQSANEYRIVKDLREKAQAGLDQAENRLTQVRQRLAREQKQLESTQYAVGDINHEANAIITEVAKRCDALIIQRTDLEHKVAEDQREVELLGQNLASLNHSAPFSGTLIVPINQVLSLIHI